MLISGKIKCRHKVERESTWLEWLSSSRAWRSAPSSSAFSRACLLAMSSASACEPTQQEIVNDILFFHGRKTCRLLLSLPAFPAKKQGPYADEMHVKLTHAYPLLDSPAPSKTQSTRGRVLSFYNVPRQPGPTIINHKR